MTYKTAYPCRIGGLFNNRTNPGNPGFQVVDRSENPPFMMRQTNYPEKHDGEWNVLHEHTSMAAGWDGSIDESEQN